MGNVTGTPPYFFYEFSLISISSINTHEYAKVKICISAQNERTMPGILFSTKFGSLGLVAA